MTSHSANSLSISEILKKIKKTSIPSNDKEIIDLVCLYLKERKQDHTPFDAYRWIEIMHKNHEIIPFSKSNFSLSKKYDKIKHRSLLFNLNEHAIPLSIASQYLSELVVYLPCKKKHYYVLGFAHDKDGFAIYNPVLNDWIGEPALTFIRGKNLKSDSIHVFHDIWDYLSQLSFLERNDLENDAIILNSYECVPQVKVYIQQYGYRKAYTWLSNDTTGVRARRRLGVLFLQESNLKHIAMNLYYLPFLSLNDWYRSQINNNK